MPNLTDPKIFENITKPMRYRASYIKKSYTVTWKNWDGTVLKTETVAALTSATPPNTPIKDGCQFLGWDKEYTKITADIEIVATFYTATTYTVTWIGYNGDILKTEEVLAGQSATPPTPPTVDGKVFDKWDKSYTSISSSIEINAIYVSTYIIQWKDWNGTVLKTETLKNGDIATPPSNPTRDGYTFAGWGTTNFTITGDTVFTAQYEQAVGDFKICVLKQSTGSTNVPADITGPLETIAIGSPVSYSSDLPLYLIPKLGDEYISCDDVTATVTDTTLRLASTKKSISGSSSVSMFGACCPYYGKTITITFTHTATGKTFDVVVKTVEPEILITLGDNIPISYGQDKDRQIWGVGCYYGPSVYHYDNANCPYYTGYNGVLLGSGCNLKFKSSNESIVKIVNEADCTCRFLSTGTVTISYTCEFGNFKYSGSKSVTIVS